MTELVNIHFDLNPQQQEAASHRDGPLLLIAGAGTGKTRTLVHRVAWLVERGVDPRRILLLTFTRRAAAEMLRRVDGLLRIMGTESASTGKSQKQLIADTRSRKQRSQLASRQIWGGTFHSIATRMLRTYGKSIGLDPDFVIHDRSDSEDLLNVIRTEQGFAKSKKKFPRKNTCMAIYSHCVNAQQPLETILKSNYPWCEEHTAELKELFRLYVDRKESARVLDYDDLLLFWHGLLNIPDASAQIVERFDHVLVDEYQDTNRLQGELLQRLRPEGNGLMVVGDDAQSIYSFRAATVRNILDFPEQFPGTTVLKLEQNYRSTPAILNATNKVIGQAEEGFAKELWSDRTDGPPPQLVTCEDEDEQADFIVDKLLEQREEGIELRNQAVLFRASHHSMGVEAELARHNIPFVKYGGLKFVETAHVKDLMSFLRLAENPLDIVAGLRMLTLLPGIGPAKAKALMDVLLENYGDFSIWDETTVPKTTIEYWSDVCKLMKQLSRSTGKDVSAQIHAVRKFYEPLLEEQYENSEPRLRDLAQLEQLARKFNGRGTMLSEIALDPPMASDDLADEDASADDDYVVLSTIHSAKGLEWDTVFVLNAADGSIPSKMAVDNQDELDEELRLFYVALTRAKNHLYVCYPQRTYFSSRGPMASRYGCTRLTRFLPAKIRRSFDQAIAAEQQSEEQVEADEAASAQQRQSVRDRTRSLWS